VRARVYNGSFADPSRVLGLSVPSVFSVLKSFCSQGKALTQRARREQKHWTFFDFLPMGKA